jgi:Ca-activated chloride channel family protein
MSAPLALCLVLLLDARGSIDAGEWELQARATGEALTDPAILDKIEKQGGIAVTAMEWSSGAMPILPWTRIENGLDAARAAVAIAAHPRAQNGATAIGDALLAAAGSLNAAPPCARAVVDISGDGTSNAGTDPKAAVAALRGIGALVNAVVIEDEGGVLDYYRDLVSGFVLPASWEGYAHAIKLKLQLEVSSLDPPPGRKVEIPELRP